MRSPLLPSDPNDALANDVYWIFGKILAENMANARRLSPWYKRQLREHFATPPQRNSH